MINIAITDVDVTRSGGGLWPKVEVMLNSVAITVTQIEGAIDIQRTEEDRTLDVFDLADLLALDVNSIMDAHDQLLQIPGLAMSLLTQTITGARLDMAEALEATLKESA